MTTLSHEDIKAYINDRKANWKNRSNSLTTLIENLQTNGIETLKFITTQSEGIALQISDLRTAIVNKASQLVQETSKTAVKLDFNLEQFSETFLKDKHFIKAMGSGNKVINIHALNAFKALFEEGHVSFESLESLYLTQRGNKNKSVRQKVALGFIIYIANAYTDKKDKLKFDHLNFFSLAVDNLLRDACEAVRNNAKKAKAELERLESLLKGEVKIAKGSGTEEMHDARTMSRSRDVIRSNNQIHGPIDKYQTVNLAKIGDTGKNDLLSNPGDINNLSKTQAKYKSVSDFDLLSIIEDTNHSAKEKVEMIKNTVNDEYIKKISFMDLKNLLDEYQHIKNFELKKTVSKIIEKTNISSFLGNVLSYIEKEKLLNKTPFKFFVSKVMKESFIDFIDFFMLKNNGLALKLLKKRFDAIQFDILLKDQPETAEHLLNTINSNFVKQKSKGFLNMNVKLLKLITKNKIVKEQCQSDFFGNEFVDFMTEHNPEFLKELGYNLSNKMVIETEGMEIDKDTLAKPITPIENKMKIESMEKLPDIQQILYRHENSIQIGDKVTQKETLETIIEYVKTNGQLDQISMLDIIDLMVKIQLFINVNEGMVLLYSNLMTRLANLYEECPETLQKIHCFMIDLIWKNQCDIPNIIKSYLKGTASSKLISFLISIIDTNKENKLIVILDSISCLLKESKESPAYNRLCNEFHSSLPVFTNKMKCLFNHNAVTVRKRVVNIIVNCQNLMTKTDFTDLLTTFDDDQKTLIEIYIQNNNNEQ